jgi:hypothetical protein
MSVPAHVLLLFPPATAALLPRTGNVTLECHFAASHPLSQPAVPLSQPAVPLTRHVVPSKFTPFACSPTERTIDDRNSHRRAGDAGAARVRRGQGGAVRREAVRRPQEELAARAGVDERYTREWLHALAAAG